MFTSKFTSSWKIFLVKRSKNKLGFREHYILKVINLCAKIMLNTEKTVQMSDFIPDVVSLPRVKLYVTTFH